jgi:Poly(hydroxyalcanoate) granule associated protein (phasin)
MLKSNLTLQPNRLGEAAINASRQMWLASLGAAVVTRDWVQTEAGGVFKTLVKEGTVVESRAIRFVGDRIENSVSFANSVWKQTRRTVESTVKQAADTAVSIAQQVLPKSLPAFELPGMPKAGKANNAKRAAKAKKPVRANAAKRAKRSRKTATKRA